MSRLEFHGNTYINKANTPTLHTPVQHSSGGSNMAIRHKMEIRGINIEKEVKSFLLAGVVILSIKNPNKSTKFYLN